MIVEIPEVDLSLETSEHCPHCCHGYEWTLRPRKKKQKCKVCGGYYMKIVPSDFGKSVLEFIKKYKDRIE